MSRIYQIEDDDYSYNKRESDMLEKAFKEGCEHGYKKAMKERENFNEKQHPYNDDFESKIERLKRKYE